MIHDSTHCLVRVELVVDRTKVSSQRAIVEIEINVSLAIAFVRSDLAPLGFLGTDIDGATDTLLDSDILCSLTESNHRNSEKFLLELIGGFGEIRLIICNFTHRRE